MAGKNLRFWKNEDLSQKNGSNFPIVMKFFGKKGSSKLRGKTVVKIVLPFFVILHNKTVPKMTICHISDCFVCGI